MKGCFCLSLQVPGSRENPDCTSLLNRTLCSRDTDPSMALGSVVGAGASFQGQELKGGGVPRGPHHYPSAPPALSICLLPMAPTAFPEDEIVPDRPEAMVRKQFSVQ